MTSFHPYQPVMLCTGGKAHQSRRFSIIRFSFGWLNQMGVSTMRLTSSICRIRITRKSNFLLPVVALLACGTAMAQSPTYNVGRPPTAEELHTWDNLVGAKGKELPI